MNNYKRAALRVSDNQIFTKLRRSFPGVLVCVTIAMAASFLSGHYGGPLMLYALLFGMAFNFLADNERCMPGIELSARKVLRVGVALLGARITFAQVAALGMQTVLMVVATVALTIGFGWLLARRLGLRSDHGLLSGGAVAICGASAALAISSVLPRHPDAERNLILTVVSVTTLSTVAMVVYPLIASALGMSDHIAGVFLGATIHDVAQVVGAGYMISTETGDTSTIVKLLRVALLVPVVLAFGILLGRGGSGTKAPLLPRFLLGFAVLVAANSFGWVPETARNILADLSGALLVTAIAALGIKTSFHRLANVGWKPVMMIVAETLFLALLVLIVLQTDLSA
ncbi:YeiH family protein [Halomonas korlensis]|uniref:Conserved hypothetical integral membrane protein n=1 Tax=Halomonas korlensis TaxID=463301 RepID=A0A1I7GIV1_9GAMM|nr:YeiH family protein [Halomonas korlensis]SFU48422.1 conserved hypothetical integral membrane protein [Halomonas korlensis]